MRKTVVRQPGSQCGGIVGRQPSDVERTETLTAEHVDRATWCARRVRRRPGPDQPGKRWPPRVAVLDARRGEPAEFLEHLGVAERDARDRRHRHHPRGLVRTTGDRQGHQDVLGRAVPRDQRALVGDRCTGVVRHVRAATACPCRARDAEHQTAEQENECDADRPTHPWQHDDLLPRILISGRAPAPRSGPLITPVTPGTFASPVPHVPATTRCHSAKSALLSA